MESVTKHSENSVGEDTGMKPRVMPSEDPSVCEKREGKGEAEDTGHAKNSSSSMMLGLLEEFTKIYSDRLQRVEETAMKKEGKEYLENKVTVLESWVRDLGEQNEVLVATVEELEREAAERVALLEDRLTKMAATTRQSCVSLRDHQIQVSSLVSDKISLEKETKTLDDKMHTLERRNMRLLEENAGLHSDINSLIQVITRARGTGRWETEDLTFSFVTPEQLFGPVLSSSRQSSPSLKESHHDFFHHLIEEPLKKDQSSAASSSSNLPDLDGSTYGGPTSDKALVISKLRAELQHLQSRQEDANTQLLERDEQIVDLQSQLTEMKCVMAGRQTEANTLHQFLDSKKQESHETTRREEMIRRIMSKKSSMKDEHSQDSCSSHSWKSYSVTGKRDETQLSENIEVLVSRLAEVEDECQQLQDQYKTLQDSHRLCAPTITMLKEQLNRSHQVLPNLNGVSTEELSRTSSGCYSNVSQSSQVLKLENELAEKSILLRELQSHLATSRQELHLKDETLYKVEQKLDSSRRDGGEKGERMHYLTSQLTNLQLEVGRTHGQAEQLRRQVENKNELIHKLETENSSMTQQLNDKSSTLERFQTELMKISTELDNKKKESSEQRLTISALQDALVSSKRSCDELRSRLSSDVSASMQHHSNAQQMHNCSNNPPASTASPSVNKSISLDTLSIQPPRDTPDACMNNNSHVSCHTPTTTESQSPSGFNSQDALYNDTVSSCKNPNFSDPVSNCKNSNFADPVSNCKSSNFSDPVSSCKSSNLADPHSLHSQHGANASENVPESRPTSQSAKEATTQTTPGAFAPDVLSSCGGNSFFVNSVHESNPHVKYLESDTTTITSLAPIDSLATADEKTSREIVGESPRSVPCGQVYDV